ncbi:class I SAM-dependent methyltransferase [Roseibium porphyridii]|uniref:Class I SAM-dependent methyltransferase n=1 Tax=Roseibium porphyridii TaxID=2866279 RepID=A0ABY8EYD4_9HYPH|nr:class I SAM-dependent methyltransferase [Roseibium sp. KMA01]WFE88108.1 class I SAM-dependent methyltransferase [Roseibium sp. KMA01]
MTASIFQTLSKIGVASEANKEVFAHGTRDRSDITVYRDRHSGVIYIDNFYGGDEIYEEGKYRSVNLAESGNRDFEVSRDAMRRSEAYRKYICGRDIVDFGCGDGAFLRRVEHEAASVTGVELQKTYVEALNNEGIPCQRSLEFFSENSMDTVVSFHVLEHLPEPMLVLNDIFRLLKPGGLVVVEVPHARDFLLEDLQNDAFQLFTLWSQHLVLHTRESLRRLLAYSGFVDITVEGVQRYPVSNHLTWLSFGKPGGHKSPLALIDTPELSATYEAALNRIDRTDTLVAIARKPG